MEVLVVLVFVIQFHCTCVNDNKSILKYCGAKKKLKLLNSELYNAFVSAQQHTVSNSVYENNLCKCKEQPKAKDFYISGEV